MNLKLNLKNIPDEYIKIIRAVLKVTGKFIGMLLSLIIVAGLLLFNVYQDMDNRIKTLEKVHESRSNHRDFLEAR